MFLPDWLSRFVFLVNALAIATAFWNPKNVTGILIHLGIQVVQLSALGVLIIRGNRTRRRINEDRKHADFYQKEFEKQAVQLMLFCMNGRVAIGAETEEDATHAAELIGKGYAAHARFQKEANTVIKKWGT